MEQIKSALELTRGEERLFAMSTDSESLFRCWIPMDPQFELTSFRLPGRFTVLGRVSRLLEEGQEESLIQLLPEGLLVPDMEKAEREILEALKNLPIQDDPVASDDMKAKYPDVFVTPIAVYT